MLPTNQGRDDSDEVKWQAMIDAAPIEYEAGASVMLLHPGANATSLGALGRRELAAG